MVVRICQAVDRRSSIGPGRTCRRAVLARSSTAARESLLRTMPFPGSSQPALSRSTARGRKRTPRLGVGRRSSLGR